ncbi:MAG: DUF4154 domain-containing protein [Bacteroidetes bacterium]|nr:DUF4154 domain-containing protein [Bacteroidota bacterium]
MITIEAQQSEISLERKVAMMMKVIDTDDHFGDGKDCFDIGILFSHHDTSSIIEKERILQFTELEPYMLTDSVPVHCIPIDLEHDDGWKQTLATGSVAAVIVTSIDQQYLGPVSSFCRDHEILSMTTVPEYVSGGLSVGVTAVNDRAMLMINLPASRTEGARISSRVLKMAKIVR